MEPRKKLGTIMLIDDEKVDQMLYKRILKRSGVADNYISFLYAEEALEYLANNGHQKIDAIFLDINMPRMNGFEFLEAATNRLGDLFASYVVIMLTTSLDPRDRERAKSFAVVRDFVTKPLSSQYLEKLVPAVLGNNHVQ